MTTWSNATNKNASSWSVGNKSSTTLAGVSKSRDEFSLTIDAGGNVLLIDASTVNTLLVTTNFIGEWTNQTKN